MIKFFRKTRQQLLNENKTSKYLKYAIGEIVLVVLGILIALSINTWNNERITKGTEIAYIDRLINEVIIDTFYFNDIKNQFEFKESRMIRVIASWQFNALPVSDSLKYINDFRSAGDIDPWYVEPVTWTQLIQTGELKLIRDKDLLDKLFNYYNSIKKVADNFNQFPMSMTNKARERWTEPFVQEDYSDFNNLGDLNKTPNAIVFENIWNNRNSYFNLYTAIAYICSNNKISMNNLEVFSKEILKTLENYRETLVN